MKRVNGFVATCGLVANYLVCFGLDQLHFAGKPQETGMSPTDWKKQNS